MRGPNNLAVQSFLPGERDALVQKHWVKDSGFNLSAGIDLTKTVFV